VTTLEADAAHPNGELSTVADILRRNGFHVVVFRQIDPKS